MKLLVIVSGDYGELAGALYFLNGLGESLYPTLLIPATLRAPDVVDAGVTLRVYATLDDVTRIVAEADPDTVMLFSGYLLTIGRRLSLLSAIRLFRMLRRRHARIVTSDPFIGLLRAPGALRFDDILKAASPGRGRVATWALARLIAVRMYLLRRQLRNEWHIYPAAFEPRHFPTKHRWLGYFNDTPPVQTGAGAAPPAVPRSWLFVLSRVDFNMQRRKLGDAFIDQVAERLRDAVRLGRRAVLIGPDELVGALAARLHGEARIALRNETAHSGYVRELMDAEYAFFWNYFSFTLIHRVVAGRPVFFFDEGHMVSILPALGSAGIDGFYAGWKPPLLAAGAHLEEDELALAAGDTRRHFNRIAEGLARCHSPRELLDIVNDSPPAPGAPPVTE